MKHVKTFLILLLLAGCQKKFSDVVARAEKEFEEKNFVNVVDTLNNGMPLWNPSDGNDLKGRAFELLGKAYHQLRNTDKALEAFGQAVNVSTNTVISAVTMGNIYLAQNQPAPAERMFDKGLQMRPKDPWALLGLGNSYYAQKRYDDARETFEKVLDVSPAVREALESLMAIKAAHAHPPKPAPAPKKPVRTAPQRKRR